MKAMTASEARQNFGQFLDYGIKEPVVIKRHQRDLGVFLPMALYRNLVSAQNRKITRSMDKLQAEARRSGLTAAALDRLLAAENPQLTGGHLRYQRSRQRRTAVGKPG